MSPKDQEQVDLYRRYLLQKADQSPSRLMRAQILRWVEWADAVQERERENPKKNE